MKRKRVELRGYILFESTDDLQRFLELLAGTHIAEHRWQIFDWSAGVVSPLIKIPPIGWIYGIHVRHPGPRRERTEIRPVFVSSFATFHFLI